MIAVADALLKQGHMIALTYTFGSNYVEAESICVKDRNEKERSQKKIGTLSPSLQDQIYLTMKTLRSKRRNMTPSSE